MENKVFCPAGIHVARDRAGATRLNASGFLHDVLFPCKQWRKLNQFN